MAVRNAIIAAAVIGIGVAAYLLTRGAPEAEQPPPPTRATEQPRTEQPAGFGSRTPPSLPEATAPSVPTFRRLRGNGDPDRRSRRAERRGDRRAQFDTDGDGNLDEAERAAMRAARLERRAVRTLENFDSDGDGELDDDESTVRDWARDDRMADRTARMISEVDENADGKLSREEAEAGGRRIQRLLRNFDEVDVDGDALISAEEMQRAMAERRQRRDRQRNDAGPQQ